MQHMHYEIIDTELKLNIRKICKNDLILLRQFDITTFKKIEQEINKISKMSSEDQKLNGILTSLDNIIDKDYIIYCLYIEQKEIIGILKIGTKNLYLYDNKNILHNDSYICVLDFYVKKDFQRKGLGYKLFNYMLKDTLIDPSKLCYDNPSIKFQNFLKKYYSAKNLIKQPNNYVIYPELFQKCN